MALKTNAQDATTVSIYTSSETERFSYARTQFAAAPDAEFDLTKVYPSHKKQEIIGFGGAFTEAAAHTFFQLAPEAQEALLVHYFSPEGCAYNLCRTHIQSCDFALGSYAYIKDKKDKDLASFSIEHDLEQMVPFMQRACAINPELEILASPWSPPGFMKTNKMMRAGGSLKEKYYSRWAQMVARYVAAMRAQGLPITRLTVQNEVLATQVWDSCLYTAMQERTFACSHLKPALEGEGLGDVKVFIWDHNKDRILDRAIAVLGYDSKAGASQDKVTSSHVAELGAYVRGAIDGIAFHWYTGDHFEALAETVDCFGDLEFIMTEMCNEYVLDSGNDVGIAGRYAHEMIGDFNAGAQGFIDWNLLLGADGGPNYAKNYCNAPLMAKAGEEAGSFAVGLESIYIAHMSRFVKRGARRVVVSRPVSSVDAVGFVNPDGQTVVVAYNSSDKPYKLNVAEGQRVVSTSLAPHAIATLTWEKW